MLKAEIIQRDFEIDDCTKLGINGVEFLAFDGSGLLFYHKDSKLNIKLSVFEIDNISKLEVPEMSLTQIDKSLSYTAKGHYNPETKILDVGFEIDLSEYEHDNIGIFEECYIQMDIHRFDIEKVG